ncbi:MAG: thiamine biosynthesis protein ThiI [Methanosaeta sp. PtaB.Bin039]|nr:MAG: thiamine biosynthesis protein ThiI [Methanosaeta sp. PtaB.Bin039]HOT06523.1 tRNA uracil 4-sulfurtransferase ThiI [Methanotrichaceae archaeon]HQF15604.1 tRNA uracil 4-sulfurtransferase ThiI [Methanotrichaceae archaeon]HQI90340.1 tRNA uracil 4-sulfurtransferase ThiI [Methanotrichaceae archaeon]HQJ28582.1 tRNA uracil 4-sulfurtransferase ThiI [Methanotrichaceae archaeon]
MSELVLVRYGEIALKDRWTRSAWERILEANLAHDLREAGVSYRLSRTGGRIFVHTTDERAACVAARVFGVVSVSPAWSVSPDIASISSSAVELARAAPPGSFAIRARRSAGAISSQEIAVEVGSSVQQATGRPVDLSCPKLEIFVEARQDHAFLFQEILPGVGGLPLGSQAPMVALLSGGIDSPVAAWTMMRRGCPVSLLHFDARPYADSLSQARRCAQVLQRWASGRRINFVVVNNSRGIGLIASKNPRATCVLCRRLMYRVATEIMHREGAVGLITGYSLGQVASQTPENIMAEQVGLNAAIYHPLIGMDKTEIVDLARRIGTLEITEETKSCTAVPSKPMTKARLDVVLELEKEMDLIGLARELAEEAEVERI